MVNLIIKNLKQGTESLNYGRQNIVQSYQEYIQMERFNENNKMTVIDVGAGVGTDLDNIKPYAPNGTVYIALESYTPCHEGLIKKGYQVVSANIERDVFSCEASTIDFLIANQILEHTKDIFWILSEFARVIKPGGRAVIGVPNLASFHNRIALLLGMQPTCIEPLSAHVRGFTQPGMMRLLQRNDYFKILSVTGSNFYPFPAPIAKTLSKYFPSLSVCLFFVVERTTKEGSFIEVLEQDFYETNYYKGV